MRLMHSSTWKITVDAEVIGNWYFAGGWLYSINIWVINLWVNQPRNPRLKSVQGSVQLRWHQVPVIISVGVPKNGDVLALKTRKADMFGAHDIKTHTHTHYFWSDIHLSISICQNKILYYIQRLVELQLPTYTTTLTTHIPASVEHLQERWRRTPNTSPWRAKSVAAVVVPQLLPRVAEEAWRRKMWPSTTRRNHRALGWPQQDPGGKLEKHMKHGAFTIEKHDGIWWH